MAMSMHREIDGFLLRGILVMAIVAGLYITIENPNPATTGLLAAVFLAGALLAVSSPTRWSVPTTVRLYQAIPLLPGISGIAAGSYFASTFDVPYLSAIVIGFGVAFLAALLSTPWDDVAARLERLKATESDDPVSVFPPQLVETGRYAGTGLLVSMAALVIHRVIVDPNVGQALVLAALFLAGLLHAIASPHVGPPRRIVRIRQARIGIPIGGTAAASAFWLLTGAWVAATLWLLVAGGLLYWGAARTDWDETRDAIERVQERTASDFE